MSMVVCIFSIYGINMRIVHVVIAIASQGFRNDQFIVQVALDRLTGSPRNYPKSGSL